MDGSGEFTFLLFDTQAGKIKNEKRDDMFHAFARSLGTEYLQANSCNRVSRLKVAGACEKTNLILNKPYVTVGKAET